MNDRPDWIKCVRHTHEDLKTQSWCGRRLEVFEFAFMDADHAAENGRQGGRLVACGECAAAITAALGNGATPAPAQPDPDPKDVMIGQIHVALRLAGLMLVRTEQGLKVERTLEATAEWAEKARFNDGPTPNDPPFLFGDEPAIAAAPAQPDPLHVANERGEGEPVAWRYERNGNRVEFHAHRLDHFYWDDIKQDYIKGTPLYLRPCRPAKVIPNSVESDGFKADARLLPSAVAPTSPTPAQEEKP